jgi:hypothetical protein
MNTIKDTETLMKNIELYNALRSLILCNDNQCVFNKDDPEIKEFLFSIEAGILHGHTDHYNNERFSYIMKMLRKMYKKVSHHKINKLFSQTPLAQEQAQPLAHGQAQPMAQEQAPKGHTYPPSANKIRASIHPTPLVYNYQTIMNAVSEGKRTFSSYPDELQNKFKHEFKQRYGYDLIGNNDNEIKNILHTRTEKDENKGGRKTKKLNKKYLKSRKHK